MATPTSYTVDDLPGLDCGVCGMRSCEELAARLPDSPELIKRCIYLSDNRYEARQVAAENRANPLPNTVVANPIPNMVVANPVPTMSAQPVMASCAVCAPASGAATSFIPGMSNPYRDSLGREFDSVATDSRGRRREQENVVWMPEVDLDDEMALVRHLRKHALRWPRASP